MHRMTKLSFSTATDNATRKFPVLLVEKAATYGCHESLRLQHHECGGISQREGQETESRGGWAVLLPVRN